MLRQNPDPLTSEFDDPNNRNLPPQPVAQSRLGGDVVSAAGRMDIQQEMNRLEEMILDSPRVPLSRRTLIDEDQILEQLDLLRLSLPPAFQEATEVLNSKEAILLEAEHYAQEVIHDAERRASEILNEMGLIRQAEEEAKQIRQRVQRECEEIHTQAVSEVDQLRRQVQQEIEELRMMAIAECEDIQRGADAYADRVLRDMEQQMVDMIRVIRNGRQQLQIDASSASMHE